MNSTQNERWQISRKGFLWAMFLTSALCISGFAAPRIHGDAHKFDLERKSDAINFSSKSSLILLRHLGGLGITSSAEITAYNSLKFTISSKGQTVREILDIALKQAPDLKWDASKEMVRISPRVRPPDNSPLRILDKSMGECVSSGLAVTNSIMFISQQANAAGLQVLAPPARNAAAWKEIADLEPADARLTVDIRKPITLRECLDAIVSSDPPSFWLAAPSPDGKRLVLMGDSGHVHKEKSREQIRIRQQPHGNGRALPGNREDKPKQ